MDIKLPALLPCNLPVPTPGNVRSRMVLSRSSGICITLGIGDAALELALLPPPSSFPTVISSGELVDDCRRRALAACFSGPVSLPPAALSALAIVAGAAAACAAAAAAAAAAPSTTDAIFAGGGIGDVPNQVCSKRAVADGRFVEDWLKICCSSRRVLWFSWKTGCK